MKSFMKFGNLRILFMEDDEQTWVKPQRRRRNTKEKPRRKLPSLRVPSCPLWLALVACRKSAYPW
jgi:hypothetical protein